MRRLLWILPLLLLLASCNNYRASRGPADWIYVATTGNDGTGDGSAGAPYLTIAHAIDQASAGDTVYVNAGTYTITSQVAVPAGISIMGAGETTIITSGTALNPIIYLASASENTAGNQSISYIKLDGDATGVIGVQVRARGNVIIHHCTFVDFTDNAVRLTGQVSGSAEPTNHAQDNEVHDCTFTNCGGETYSAPYYFASAAIGLSGQKDAIVYNNSINNSLGNYAYGINTNGIGYNRGLNIHDNSILVSPKHVASNQWSFAIELWNNTGGITVKDNYLTGSVDFGGSATTDAGGYGFALLVESNTIVMSGLQPYDHCGIYIESDVSGGGRITRNYIKNFNNGILLNTLSGPLDHQEDITIDHNVILETTKNTGNYSGRAIGHGTAVSGSTYEDIRILNNTVYTWSYKASAGFHFASSGVKYTNTLIQNNIIDNAYNSIRFENDTIAGLDITNNCFYGQTNATSYVSVVASDTTTTNNISADPLFKSASDQHLQSTSPCINAGIDVGLTSDFAGHRVPQQDTVDIGAYEYGNYLFRTPSGKLLRNANGKLMITH